MLVQHARILLDTRQHQLPVLAGVGNPLPTNQSLPYARAELDEIARMFPEGSARPLYEEKATKEALLQVLPGASYIHFSCHGLFDPGEPLDSHLQLSNHDTLTLREVLNNDWFKHSRLVALSACQTAISEFNNLPDEAIGLHAGFLAAGVPGLIGTLWMVPDHSTAWLMTALYQYHLRGNQETGAGPLPPKQALKEAQRSLREITNDSPYHWAPFIFMGV